MMAEMKGISKACLFVAFVEKSDSLTKTLLINMGKEFENNGDERTL
jgi:hypothetical protein